MALLEVDGVRAGYEDGPDILQGLSLRLEPGRVYCVIGPNGAGKSTLLRVVAGVLSAREGAVRFAGERIDGLRPDQVLRKGISMVPQDRSLFPDMTVRENLIMGGYVLNDRRAVLAKLEQSYRAFPILRERSAQTARTLSGGEQQMVAIERAMVLQPKLILLDEPSMGLAPRVARQIFASVRRMKEAGVTVLLVEQNARMGLEAADWGIVLTLGSVSLEGPAHQVLSDPRIEELYLGRRPQAHRAEAT